MFNSILREVQMRKMSEGVEEEVMEGKMRTINRDKNKLEENSIKSLKHS